MTEEKLPLLFHLAMVTLFQSSWLMMKTQRPLLRVAFTLGLNLMLWKNHSRYNRSSPESVWTHILRLCYKQSKNSSTQCGTSPWEVHLYFVFVLNFEAVWPSSNFFLYSELSLRWKPLGPTLSVCLRVRVMLSYREFKREYRKAGTNSRCPFYLVSVL